MKRSSLLLLMPLFLFSCKGNNNPTTRIITRDEAQAIANKYSTAPKTISKIELSWENKTKDNDIQNTLKTNYGVTDDFKGTNTITDSSIITTLQGKDAIKCNLNKDTFDKYFSDSYTFEYIVSEKLKAKEEEINAKDKQFYYTKEGYIEKLYVSETNTVANIDYWVSETFYY